MVRLAGLEPARVTPLPPQSSVSANSTISATVDLTLNCLMSATMQAQDGGQTHLNCRMFLMRAARRDPLRAWARALPGSRRNGQVEYCSIDSQ